MAKAFFSQGFAIIIWEELCESHWPQTILHCHSLTASKNENFILNFGRQEWTEVE